MTILHDLIALYNSLSSDRIYHEVIAILLKNLSLIPELTLEETAELCNTSIITINRLLKRIKCPSFRAFKQQLTDVIDGYAKYNRVFPYATLDAANITQSESWLIDNYFSFFTNHMEDLSSRITISQIEQACKLLHEASDIHFYGEYAASHAKQQFQVDLMYSGKQVISLCDVAEQEQDSLTLTKNSLILAQSIATYKTYSAHLPLMKRLHSAGITTVIITSTTTPNSSKFADCLLTFKGTDTAMDNYFIDMIFNLLCITYRSRYID